jgi:hypothetical protein
MSKKQKSEDNPALPLDVNNPTDDEKNNYYVWKDGELVIDSQMHIYNETPDENGSELLTQVTDWLHGLEIYQQNQEHFDVFYTAPQLYRFCRARQFKFEKIKEMILENIKWRLEDGKPSMLRYADLQIHAATGKTHLRQNRDQYGRPVIVLHNKYNHSTEFEIGAQLTFYTLEKSVREMNFNNRGPSRHVVFLNMEGFSYMSQPPMSIAKKVGYAISSGYPETLGAAIIYDYPWTFKAFYKAIASIMLDDRTKSKIFFISKDDKDRDGKFEFLLGPNWKELTGIDQPQADELVAPGFYPEEFDEYCFADDEKRFGNRLGAKEAADALEKEQRDAEEAELEGIKPKCEVVEVLVDEEKE